MGDFRKMIDILSLLFSSRPKGPYTKEEVSKYIDTISWVKKLTIEQHMSLIEYIFNRRSGLNHAESIEALSAEKDKIALVANIHRDDLLEFYREK